MRDIDPPIGPCDCCGHDPEGDCVCPECPVCGATGDPVCYREHGLTYSAEQLAGQKALADEQAEDAKAEVAMFAELEKSQLECPHDRLDEDGICRGCGADRRGI